MGIFWDHTSVAVDSRRLSRASGKSPMDRGALLAIDRGGNLRRLIAPSWGIPSRRRFSVHGKYSSRHQERHVLRLVSNDGRHGVVLPDVGSAQGTASPPRHQLVVADLKTGHRRRQPFENPAQMLPAGWQAALAWTDSSRRRHLLRIYNGAAPGSLLAIACGRMVWSTTRRSRSKLRDPIKHRV